MHVRVRVDGRLRQCVACDRHASPDTASAELYIAVALAATLIPARRATRVDPIEVLRAH